MKIYIAGPMSGIPEHNFPAFTEAAATLRAQGHEIINPAEITLNFPGEPGLLPWEVYLREDLKQMLTCQGIALLPGWRDSRGASVELFVADKLKFFVYTYREGQIRRSLRYGSSEVAEV